MDSQLQAFLILLAIGAWHYFSSLETKSSIGNAVFGASTGILHLHSQVWDNKNETPFEGVLGQEFNFKIKDTNRCPSDGEHSDCIEWEGVARLKVEYTNHHDIECYEFAWETFSKDADPHDCFKIGDDHWYGGAHLRRDRWLIEEEPIQMTQFLSCDIGVNRFEYGDSYGSVLQPYWLSSKGLAIFVDDENVPLHVGINNSHLCLKADYESSWYPNPTGTLPKLVYNICVGSNVKTLHEFLSRELWSKPIGIPDKSLFKYPIWSTWAKYKTDINQSKVLEFASEIQSHGFKSSQIEIDDMYTPKYGDIEFDSQKFPEPLNMTNALHSMGFRVTSWITPFFNLDSKAILEGEKLGHFVKDQRGVPGLVSWWHGTAAILDPTSPKATKWFKNKLENLRDVGVDSFKFDAGESNFLPPGYKTHRELHNPNQFSKKYAEMVYSFSDKRIEEVRVGHKTQHLPIMVRMMDKDSNWGYDRGIKSVIPSCLLFGLLGYPFVLPDMIGGNAYNEYAEASGLQPNPDKELFIRWLELSAFLPVMQYSIAPWQYDDNTVALAHHYDKIHSDYVYPKVLQAAKQSVVNGSPIIRPLWWHSPDDRLTYSIRDQFLLGESVLVAPILDKDSTHRDIYLPEGMWRDMLRNTTLQGPTYLQEYVIDLHEIAYFELENYGS